MWVVNCDKGGGIKIGVVDSDDRLEYERAASRVLFFTNPPSSVS